MLGFEAAPEGGRWGLMFDYSFVDVRADGSTRSVESNQSFLEADAYYRLPDLGQTDLYVGLRAGRAGPARRSPGQADLRRRQDRQLHQEAAL